MSLIEAGVATTTSKGKIMGISGRRIAAGVSTAAVVGLGLVAQAPSASAQNCIVSSYSNGYRSWCAPAAGGTWFATVTTCRDYWRPARTYTVTGNTVRQGANSWSYALCAGSDTPIGAAISKW